MTPLEHALALARGGQAALEAHRGRLNDLNVYPVPDGDTGSNLADTAARLTEGLESLREGPGRGDIARAATRAALMGARGNSGVILSQIVRGFAESLGAETGSVDAAVLARALRSASDAAYGAVRQPVEGTMLTAIRAMAEQAEREAGAPTLEAALDRVLQAGDEAVARTTAMLPVLRQAGVVDAGAAGLVEFVRGAVAGLGSRPPAPAPALTMTAPISLDAIHLDPGPYRYCTSFLIEGDGVDRERLESLLEPLGDSLLVVGDAPVYKVHLHTDDPGAALSIGVAAGAVAGVEVADMHEGTRDRTLRLLDGGNAAPTGTVTTALVAVASGDGVAAAFREAVPSVVLVPGGQSANPSAGEIAAGLAGADAAAAVVLPNNRNAVLAAEHATALDERPARVVPSVSPAAGLVLAGRFDASRALEANAGRLADLNVQLRCGEVARATRAARLDGVGVTAGQHMAIVEGKVVGAYDDEAPAGRALVSDLARGAAAITLLVGDDTGLAAADWLAEAGAAAPGVEVRVVDGGQPVYSLMACAEPAAPSPARPRGAPLTAETTALVFDSTVDLADPSARHPNWSMVPLTVSFGTETFRDYVDIGPEEFYRRLRTAPEPPRTAAPSPGAWQSAFEQLDSFARVLVLPVSSKLSASAQSAELAARELDPDAHRITVLQTASASLGTLVLAEGLQRRLVRGLPENEVMLWFEAARERLGVIFSVDTLEYLRRGGRIGRAQALVGGVLRMRPILALQDGEVAPLQRVRGAARAQQAFERFLVDHATGSHVHTAIVHADAPDAARRLEEMVHRAVPAAVVDHVGELGAVVGTHGGPGTLGLAVLSEP